MVIYCENGFKFVLKQTKEGKDVLSHPYKSLKDLYTVKSKLYGIPLEKYKFHNIDLPIMKVEKPYVEEEDEKLPKPSKKQKKFSVPRCDKWNQNDEDYHWYEKRCLSELKKPKSTCEFMSTPKAQRKALAYGEDPKDWVYL